MSERPIEIKKLADIAADRDLPSDLRTKAIEQLGNIGTHEALLALLELAANQELATEERDVALQEAREIIKSGH
jgi:hypothetical protein